MQSESDNHPKPVLGDLQDQDGTGPTPEQSFEPDSTSKKEDGSKNKIHPELSPPQVILGETQPIVGENREKVITKESLNEKSPLIGTPLSPPNEKVLYIGDFI